MMEKNNLIEVFKSFLVSDAWSLQLVQIKNSVKNGIYYVCREIHIEPEQKLLDFIQSITDYYCSDEGIACYKTIDNYTGDIIDHVIYKLEKDSPLIAQAFDVLIKATAKPDREMKITEIKPTAVLFIGSAKKGEEDIPVMLVSMQKPLSVLKNKFIFSKFEKRFKELDEPILTLKRTVDVAIIGDTVYLFSLSGEKLFNIERTYKTLCKKMVGEIAECGFISDKDFFINAANHGANPRRFVAYNKEHFDWLKKADNRKKAAEKFGLKMKQNNIDTSDVASVEKLVKFLCNKAMLDPCDARPIEVAASKPWS
ncbi:MAG: DUF4868 domain-containing protein [Succiniclasticum sp.]|uniref:Kiwa anti-phage protein KwaB-like domain-containing protein n=1 Tax=Succiniclasticum sp. TaxID=2775030 RepID=UPI002A9138D8|nr:Kiwa anti-phage protein KwaB-like domain-containing protein [Succiniclasticum sp.]MDY6291567.1 DUF4868 domain-containing protein [Succiniclasticum sp.]